MLPLEEFVPSKFTFGIQVITVSGPALLRGKRESIVMVKLSEVTQLVVVLVVVIIYVPVKFIVGVIEFAPKLMFPLEVDQV